MTTVTHALAPVILVRLLKGRKSSLSKWDYLWIGLAGGLADVINPHYYLVDRLTSWSHGLPFLVVFSVFLFASAWLIRLAGKNWLSMEVAVYCMLAYAMHLLVDGFSGGINLFYPLKDYFWSVDIVPSNLVVWVAIDVMNLVITKILFWRKRET